MYKSKRFIAMIAVVLLAATTVFAIGCSKKEEAPAPEKKPAVSTAAAVEQPPEEPEIRWPYTGLPATSPEAITNRPLSIKIENSSEAWPQMGLNAADVIYETRVEGGISRFNCIYQSNIPEEVGPVRSARLSDAWVVPQYQGMLFFSGSNSEVRARLKGADVTLMNGYDKLYHRVDFKRAPHNLYMDASIAYEVAADHDVTFVSDSLKPLYFGEPGDESVSTTAPEALDSATSSSVDASDAASSASSAAAVSGGKVLEGFTGESAASIEINFLSTARWDWDAGRQVWLRSTSDKEHMDGATDERVFTDNVVVMYADYPQAQKRDPAGSPTYDTVLGGTGDAMLLRDGYVYKCKWEADENTPPKLVDEAGNQLPLKPGKTWFEVPPIGMEVTVE
jgi:hypothetical protein